MLLFCVNMSRTTSGRSGFVQNHVTGIHVGGRMGPVAAYEHVTWTAGASEGVSHAGVPYTSGTY